MEEFTEQLRTAWLADLDSEPHPPMLCSVPGCGLECTAMVYKWRPDGQSVYQPRCRDHSQAVGR
jgi:hypothetical protein